MFMSWNRPEEKSRLKGFTMVPLKALSGQDSILYPSFCFSVEVTWTFLASENGETIRIKHF